ncbi:MAG TPA: hypothetical protein VMU15_12385 [Anaeromyxobacter sp.]|nr:hypothetical protein [Anaeromyxobacter sp.]
MVARGPRVGLAGLWIAATALVSCPYTFSNPVERLGVGQVSGRTVADPLATGKASPLGGISVSLKGSTFDQVTHGTGYFTLIPLPAGKHTLLFRQGTSLSLVRHVELGLGPNGLPDAVSLGDVLVPFGGSVAGTTSDYHSGVVVDEATGLTGEVGGGRFRLDAVSLGDHVFKVGEVDTSTSGEWVGGPAGFSLGPDAQAAVTVLGVLPVHPVTASLGTVSLRVVSLLPAIAPADILVSVTEVLRGPLASVPAPDARGQVEIEAAEGIYQVAIAPPTAYAGQVTAPPAATAVAIAGEVADLGTLYLVPPGLPAADQLLCQAAADCLPAGTCAAGSCLNWAPPVVAPARVPLCSIRLDFCSPTNPCTSADGLAGQCQAVGAGPYQTCVPCGTECTVDGTDLYLGGC